MRLLRPTVMLVVAALLGVSCGGLLPEIKPAPEHNTAQLKRILHENPDNAHALFLAGENDLSLGEPGNAAWYFQRAIDAKPAYEEAWMGLGLAQLDQEKYARARETFEEMARRFPSNPGAHEGLGACAIGVGDYDAVIEHANAALALNKDSAEAHRQLAEAYYTRGDYATALEHWGRARELDPALVSKSAAAYEDLRLYLKKYGE